MISIFIPSSGTIDVNENESFPVTWSIADIRNPESRKASHTKTITLPGTANNNQMFGYLFDVNIVANRFNPTLKVECVVLNDSIPVLEGHIRLLKINVRDGKDVTYECVIVGYNGNLINEFAKEKLTDLDFSDLDHTLNATNMVNSWSAPVGEGYVYPDIFEGYDKWLNVPGQTTGAGYSQIRKLSEQRPAIYVKEYIDRIFSTHGYSYTSSFFNSDRFKRLIIPSNGKKFAMTQAEAQSRYCKSSREGSDYLFTFAPSTIIASYPNYYIRRNTVIADTGNQFNTSNSILTVGKSGYYRIDWMSLFEIASIKAGGSNNNNIYIEFRIVRNSTTIVTDHYEKLATTNFTENLTLNTYWEGWLGVNDTITTYFDLLAVGSSYVSITDKTQSNMTLTPNTNGINTGELLSVNETVPEDVTQRDFFTSIVKMFNLYIDVEKDNPKNLIIEPRNDFYSSGTILDWSSKWDSGNGWAITPLAEIEANRYIYKYKSDSDWINKSYQDKFKETYGQKNWEVENDYFKSDKTTEIIFSNTPYTGLQNSSIPHITKDGTWSLDKRNIRIMYYGGTRSYTIYYKDSNGSQTSYANTPMSGHFDNPQWPTFDLSFGSPRELYHSPAIITDNNLFNVYHKDFIEEITSENSKVVVGKFRLTPYDIYTFSFNRIVFVDNACWRVSKIDFDLTSDDLYEVELIKVKEITTFVPSSGTIYGGASDTILPYDYTPVSRYTTLDATNGNSYPGSALVSGYNIFVADNAIGVIATGVELSIGNSFGVTVLNSSGVTVAGGLSNVHVVNSSGITVTESNVTYVNGVKLNQNAQAQAQLYFSSGTILSSQINTSYTNPITLISGVSGYIIEPIDCVMYCDYLTGAHTLSALSTVEINWQGNTIGGGVAPIYQVAGQSPGDFPLLGEISADYYARLVPVSLNVSPAYNVKAIVGTSLIMATSVANPTGGDIRLNYHITYRLIGF